MKEKINRIRLLPKIMILVLSLMLTVVAITSTTYAYIPADYTWSDPEPVIDYDYTIMGIPDIQNITKWKAGTLSQMFMKLTTRAKQNKLLYAFSVGDLVQDPTNEQFQTARDAFTQFDEAGIPYAFVPGNHDFDAYTGDVPTNKNATKLNSYFSYDYYKDMPTFGGAMNVGNMVNTYHLFESHGAKYLLMALDDAPTTEALSWADTIIDSYPERRTIIVTHDYFDRPNGNSIQRLAPGESVWQMAKKHANVFMIFSGHKSTLDPVFVMGTGDNGNKIMQIMICFQNTMDAAGDNVPLVLYMRFNERKKTINYSVINPITDKLFNNNQFEASFEDDKNPPIGPKDKTYKVTWRNFDGSELEVDPDVIENEDPFYNGTTPVKPADENFTYEFSGWSPTISKVTGDQNYIAQFNAIPIALATYSVYWMNYDGNLLETDLNVTSGSTPEFNGAEPTRESDIKNTYKFAGWTPSLSPVTKDVIYTAQYIPTPLQSDVVKTGCNKGSFIVIGIIGMLTVAMIPVFIKKSI